MNATPRNYQVKRCVICGESYAPTSGKQRWCRRCRLSPGEYLKQWRSEHPAYPTEYMQRWRTDHPFYAMHWNRWMRQRRRLNAALRLVEVEAPEFRMDEGR